jgi:hypothetical protein
LRLVRKGNVRFELPRLPFGGVRYIAVVMPSYSGAEITCASGLALQNVNVRKGHHLFNWHAES